MRSLEISVGEYYHIYNRGVHKQPIFHNNTDYARFLFLLLFLQSPRTFTNISRPVQHFVQHSVFNISHEDMKDIEQERYVELIAFCVMQNHFHLLIKEEKEGGVARYMQRVLNGYSKYYNTRYKKSGHVFQGPYRAVHMGANEQLLHLSAYIHRNPREISAWKNKEHLYPWSSYQDFIEKSRWGSLLVPEIILEQFKSKKEYGKFLHTSPAKLRPGE